MLTSFALHGPLQSLQLGGDSTDIWSLDPVELQRYSEPLAIDQKRMQGFRFLILEFSEV